MLGKDTKKRSDDVIADTTYEVNYKCDDNKRNNEVTVKIMTLLQG